MPVKLQTKLDSQNRLTSELGFPLLFFKAIENMYGLFQLCAESATCRGLQG